MASEQLCWRCNRPGTGTCAWDKSKGVVPVEGWTAKEVPFRDGTGIYSTTYAITDCPLFEEQEDYDERNKVLDSKARGWRSPIGGKKLEKMEFRFKCNWPLRAIADEFDVHVNTVSKYKSLWRKKQGRKDGK